MRSTYFPWYCLVAVVLIHLGGIALAVMGSETIQPKIIETSIQGVLIAPQKVEKPIVTPPPKTKPKRKHRHKPKHKPKPVPKAPHSEQAVKAPEPVPIEKPVEKIIEEPAETEPDTLVLPSADAQNLNNPAPAYPIMSRKLKEEGVVLLKILVTKDGLVSEIEINQSSGFKRLDVAAIKAIKRWKFNPATRNGQAIDYWYEVPIEFSLRKK